MEDNTNVIKMVSTDHHQNTTSSNSCATNAAHSTDNVLSNEKPKKTVLARCIKKVNRVFSPFKRKRKSPNLDRKLVHVNNLDNHHFCQCQHNMYENTIHAKITNQIGIFIYNHKVKVVCIFQIVKKTYTLQSRAETCVTIQEINFDRVLQTETCY